ncbi:hypothetical protein [Desulfofundulus thermosubterraneus]|uniref:Permease family protein n=1 Tax=Desulfofundulus thermosubterraneus DSM 16057 TaxID=1121432 RepID=A0A1M6GRN2_9FIRM|nr:hypothetical protein [Desulfofundulus thermosubterraneus]SHJ12634.1 hypothetical protein SAMN02745219_01806 [Desulfofundulus thermosubterraneus DSM 16057]
MSIYVGRMRPSDPNAEQPYILGKLKFRIPFVHYRWEWPDAIQGAMLCVVPMGIIAAMTQTLGIPFEIALTMVIINNFMYLLHTHFGDPVVAGWITPGIPLYIAFLTSFTPGPERLQAMVALQLSVAFLFLFFGITGIAGRVVGAIPNSVKAGILLGAAIASVVGEFKAGGRISQFPVSILFGTAVSFFMLFSSNTEYLRARYGLFRFVAQYGIAIPFAISYVLGLIIGEVKMPTISWSITPLFIGDMVKTLSPFNIGFPSFKTFILALPLALAAYIIAFGDILVAASLIKTCDEKRKDEKIIFEPNRTNIITGIRNTIEGLLFPYLPLAGPQWTGGQALVVNRYINSTRQQEDSYWGGATSIFWGMSIALLIGPLVSLFKPGLAIGLSLTLLLQGYLCAYLAMEMIENNIQRGIAGIMGCVLAMKGAAWGLGTGLVLYLLLEYPWFRKVISPAKTSEVNMD